MNLTNIYMDNLKLGSDLGNNANTAIISTASSSNFDNVIKKVTKKNSDSMNGKRNSEDLRNNINGRNRPDSGAGDYNSKQRVSLRPEPTRPEATKKSDSIPKEENLVKNLAEELGIPKEAIEQMLSQLNMSVADLAQHEKLNEFVQTVMNVKSPVELLAIPDIKESLDNIKNSISEYVAATSSRNSIPKDSEPIFEHVEVTVTNDNIGTQKALEVDGQGTNFSNQNHMGNHNSTENGQIGQNSQAVTNTSEFATKVSKAESLKNLNPEEILKQIVEKLKIDVKEGVSELKMILKPESLGEISLKIVTIAGIVTAEFIAQNEKVKQILESNFMDLKNALQEQGLVISSLSVSVGEQDSQDQMQRFLHEQKKSSLRISNILKNMSEEESLLENEIEQMKLLENNVNYTA